VHGLRRAASTEAGDVLRLLFVRLDAVSADADGAYALERHVRRRPA